MIIIYHGTLVLYYSILLFMLRVNLLTKQNANEDEPNLCKIHFNKKINNSILYPYSYSKLIQINRSNNKMSLQHTPEEIHPRTCN